MFTLLRKNRSKLLLILTTFLFLSWKLPELIFHPSQLLLAGDGDGLKSYYCFFYHTHYDSDLLKFTGMNYPYGEHYLYTDGFPALAWVIQLLPFLNPYGILIIHLSLILSLLVTPLLIYLILKKIKIANWVAFFGALSIFLLQPQFSRLFSHLSLAYSVFFPLSWYLLLRFKENKSIRKWQIILILNQLFWYFIHPYLGFMVSVFYGVDWFLCQWNKRDSFGNRLMTFLPVILPIISVQLFLSLTDQIHDRPITPFGFFEYQAHWKSIFIPSSGTVHDWLSSYVSFEEVRWEGLAYVGFLSILMIPFAILIITQNVWRGKQHTETTRILVRAFIAAAFLLILSFGFPFNGNPHWLDTFRFLKQFRALGRFSWVFFYVLGILGIYFLNILLTKLKRMESGHRFPYKAHALIISMFMLQINESLSLMEVPQSFSKNLFDPSQLTQEEKDLVHLAKLNRTKVQAILPLPWFHIGSEIYGKETTPLMLRNSFLASAHSGIPLYGVMLGRTSLQQTLNYFHFFQINAKVEQRQITSLLVLHDNESSLYAEDEQLIFDLARPIYKNSFGEWRFLSSEYFQKVIKKQYKLIVREDFSDPKKWGNQLKNGRYHGWIENYQTVLSLDSTQIEPNQWYDLTFDYFPDISKPFANVCHLEFVDPKTKQVNWFYQRSISSFPNQLKEKIKVHIRFKSIKFPCEYHCFFIGKSKNVSFEVAHLRLKKEVN